MRLSQKGFPPGAARRRGGSPNKESKAWGGAGGSASLLNKRYTNTFKIGDPPLARVGTCEVSSGPPSGSGRQAPNSKRIN